MWDWQSATQKYCSAPPYLSLWYLWTTEFKEPAVGRLKRSVQGRKWAGWNQIQVSGLEDQGRSKVKQGSQVVTRDRIWGQVASFGKDSSMWQV